MTTSLSEQFPPKLKILIGDNKFSLTLEAVLAIGDDAAALCHQFQAECADRLNAAISAARQKFLASQQWQNTEALRVRLSIAAGDAAAATRKLSELNVEYQERLRDGDPVSLMAALAHQRQEVENHRRAVADFEKIVAEAERVAQVKLYDTIAAAVQNYVSEGRTRYIERIGELVARLNADSLLELAVAEAAALHHRGRYEVQSGRGQRTLSDEQQRYGGLPERGFVIARESAAPTAGSSPPPSSSPAAGATWGPAPVTYPDAQPAQWGPTEPQRIA